MAKLATCPRCQRRNAAAVSGLIRRTVLTGLGAAAISAGAFAFTHGRQMGGLTALLYLAAAMFGFAALAMPVFAVRAFYDAPNRIQFPEA